MSGGSTLDIVEIVGGWEVLTSAWTSGTIHLQSFLVSSHVLQHSQCLALWLHFLQQLLQFILPQILHFVFPMVVGNVRLGSLLRSLPCHKLRECS